LEILSGDKFPTRGTAILGGHDILNEQLKVRKLIGYCPQFDALFNLLTAREHLEFYARIKGVKEANMRSIVDGMLHYLSLKEYADRPAGTYSGGNKRKLSVAIALIGDPSIVFLDEPSTGMDPSARRFMWRFISDTMRDRSVILTTH
jgi:ABC-type multidrug transport system ATPase subunit